MFDIWKTFCQETINASVFFNPAKSVEVPIELSEDCYCNLSVPIPNEQTLVTKYVLSYHKVFLIWIFDSSFGHMRNYTPAACCYVTGTSEIFLLSSLLVWWLSFTIRLATHLIAMVTQLPWQKYDTSIPPEDVSNPFCPREQPYLT